MICTFWLSLIKFPLYIIYSILICHMLYLARTLPMAWLDTNLFNEQLFESLGKTKWYLVHVDIAFLWPQPQQTCLWTDINWMLCVHVKRLLQATRLFHGFWNRNSSNSRIDKNFHEFYIWCSFAIYYFYVFFLWNIYLYSFYTGFLSTIFSICLMFSAKSLITM